VHNFRPGDAGPWGYMISVIGCKIKAAALKLTRKGSELARISVTLSCPSPCQAILRQQSEPLLYISPSCSCPSLDWTVHTVGPFWRVTTTVHVSIAYIRFRLTARMALFRSSLSVNAKYTDPHQ